MRNYCDAIYNGVPVLPKLVSEKTAARFSYLSSFKNLTRVVGSIVVCLIIKRLIWNTS